MKMPTDWQLERYRPLLRLLAEQLHQDPRLRRRFDASDVVHDAFARALANLGQFHGTSEGELVRWLQQIVHNTYTDKVRYEFADMRTPTLEAAQRALDESSHRLGQLVAAPESGPLERLQREETLLRVAAAIDRLEDNQREVVIMRYLHDLPVKEIAERLSCTKKAVTGRLLRGMEKLRALLAEKKPG
jgi:RNA polymerase sigma-70 factor (ECF subfamily)